MRGPAVNKVAGKRPGPRRIPLADVPTIYEIETAVDWIRGEDRRPTASAAHARVAAYRKILEEARTRR